ncbi:hypothetical protein cypCar_00047070 [Cyprinus carpio]|nr:hypothetical protein cypCar_00047070 [Cyprinus carpio]
MGIFLYPAPGRLRIQTPANGPHPCPQDSRPFGLYAEDLFDAVQGLVLEESTLIHLFLAGLDEPVNWVELGELVTWSYWEMVDHIIDLKEIHSRPSPPSTRGAEHQPEPTDDGEPIPAVIDEPVQSRATERRIAPDAELNPSDQLRVLATTPTMREQAVDAAMDIIEPILAIAEKLYSLCEEVKANKKRCRRLAHRVSTLAELVKTVKVHGFGTEPEQVINGLENLKLTLESAEKVLKKYTCFSYLRRVTKAYDLGEEFSCLNERLNDAAQLLSLALQFEHRESKGTNTMVDAVQKTVDQTQRDVQDIKEILESLKKPRLHLQDIREIKPEELTYSFPVKPFMKCSHSEIYKGTYNKFTVAIKRYLCPLSTSPSELRRVFNKEVETMKRFESPSILRMFGICVEDENGPNPRNLIVMEYCEKGSLRQVLDSNCNLPWERKTQMCLDAAQGLYRSKESQHTVILFNNDLYFFLCYKTF